MEQANNFLSFFRGEQIFATTSDKEKKALSHYHGTFEEALPYLHRDNKLGRGVFFCVNELDREKDKTRKRTKKMFVQARAIWVEDDNKREEPRNDWPLKPNLIVNTSPGKYHYYWLTKTKNAKEWEKVMLRMVEDHGCDSQARDLARILRIPGFKHQKGKPFDVTFKCNRKKPYDWEAIKTAFPPLEKLSTKHEALEQNSGARPGQSIRELIEQTTKGHAHGPSMSIAMSLANRGLKEDEILAILELLPEYNEGDHKHSVVTAIHKVQEEIEPPKNSLEDITFENEITHDFKWPPGLFGKMCQEAYEMAHFPYRGISIVTSVGIVAALCGRMYNASDFGLNMYVSLLMDTGMGKDMIRKIINRTFHEIDPLNGAKFVGPARFTGVPALWRTMQDSMSRIAVITEAGFLNGADIGDKKGLSATMLSMYGSSGRRDIQNSNEYSSKDTSLPDLYSPSMSIIQESTPKSFIEALLRSDGDINGDLARMWLLRLDQKKPYKNRNPRAEFSEDVKTRIKELELEALDFLDNEAMEDKVRVLPIPEWLNDINDQFIDMEEREKQQGNVYRKVMLSRGWVKSVKIAALISIFNGHEEIDKETYQWVYEEIIERELKAIEKSIRSEDTGDLDNVVKNIVGSRIIDLLRNPKKGRLNVKMADHNIFTLSSLNLILNHNKVLKDFCSRKDSISIKDGLTKIVEYMESAGFLVKIHNTKLQMIDPSIRAPYAYQVTEDLVALYKVQTH